MKIFNCPQGSAEWRNLRLGRPTASVFDQIIIPSAGKVKPEPKRPRKKPLAERSDLSRSSQSLMWKLLAERLQGYPINGITTAAMKAGHENEGAAVAWYEFTREMEIERVGICLTDDERAGASPDGFVGEDGLVEIKAPLLQTHVQYLLSGTGIAEFYRPQIQGQLWVTGRKWIDSLSYFPPYPPALVRVERDESYIAKLAAAVTQFADNLDAALERLLALGCRLPEPEAVQEYDGRFDVTEADVEAILASKGMA